MLYDFFEGINYLSSQKLLKTGITGINQLLNHDYILNELGLKIPNSKLHREQNPLKGFFQYYQLC